MPPHAGDHLAFMQSDHAAACAGELGPVKQDKIAVIEASAAHGITHDHQLLMAWIRAED
jgi:hypothetical protein